MAKTIWVVQYTDKNVEDRDNSAAFQKYEKAVARAVELAKKIVKEERDAIEWDKDQSDQLDEFLKEKDPGEAFELWEDIARDFDFNEDVTIEESTLD